MVLFVIVIGSQNVIILNFIFYWDKNFLLKYILFVSMSTMFLTKIIFYEKNITWNQANKNFKIVICVIKN
jgi:hypothetical protein